MSQGHRKEMADDLISKVKNDNTFAQRARCGNCSRPMAQTGAISESNLVNIKGKKLINSDKPAKGFLCSICLADPAKKEEGPRQAVNLSGPAGDILMETLYDNLVDMKEAGEETAITDEGKEVTRSTATGKTSRRRSS